MAWPWPCQAGAMAADPDLVDEVRFCLDGIGAREQPMFGGIGFMVDGYLALAALSHGGLLVRVGRPLAERLAPAPGVEHMINGGRPMRGWLMVYPEALATAEDVSRWVDLAVGFVRSGELPSRVDRHRAPGL